MGIPISMNTIEGNIYTVMRNKDQCYVFWFREYETILKFVENCLSCWREMSDIISPLACTDLKTH
jgi:hypothetical protein